LNRVRLTPSQTPAIEASPGSSGLSAFGTIELATDQDELAMRRKRARFRAWHRGTREMDLIMGRFADAAADGWSESEMRDYEALLDLPEADLFAWITGEVTVPLQFDTPIFRSLVDFHGGHHAAGGAA
jgi:antitoxin CptB